ncbi:G-type lectin S-receptor-like serine/threonine-protein kinase, partial [Tanacetum coccineum]
MVDSNAALPMWILTPKGQLTAVDDSTAWTPEFCYGYDSGDGCVKESSFPPCRTKNDNFNKLNGEFAPEMTRDDTDENSSLSISDCFAKCWNDCNCVGFNSKNKDGTGCVIWIGNNSFLVNLIQNSTWKHSKQKSKEHETDMDSHGCCHSSSFHLFGAFNVYQEKKTTKG